MIMMNMNILVILTILVQLGSGKNSELTPEQEKLLERHNFFRKLVSTGQVKGQPASSTPLRDLRWDPELAHYAALLTNSCSFCYDTSRIPKKKGEHIRQNIAAVTSVEEAMEVWINEHRNYDYATKACAEDGRCKNYLKIASTRTKRVGCAVHDCENVKGFPSKYFIVCNYRPGGDYEHEWPYVRTSLEPTYIIKPYEDSNATDTWKFVNSEEFIKNNPLSYMYVYTTVRRG